MKRQASLQNWIQKKPKTETAEKETADKDQTLLIQLPNDSGQLEYDPAFLSTTEATQLFQYLKQNLQWHSIPITIYGKTMNQPRLISFLKSNSLKRSYSYSKVSLPYEDLEQHEPLLNILQRIEKRTHFQYNACLCNLYRNGMDSMSLHADDEPELDQSMIASLSLGVTRKFLLKPSQRGLREKQLKSTDQKSLQLSHGSLLLMRGTPVQQYWQHSIPKEKKCTEERLNLTFRYLKQ